MCVCGLMKLEREDWAAERESLRWCRAEEWDVSKAEGVGRVGLAERKVWQLVEVKRVWVGGGVRGLVAL